MPTRRAVAVLTVLLMVVIGVTTIRAHRDLGPTDASTASVPEPTAPPAIDMNTTVIEQHLADLAAIAAQHGGNRAAGTAGYAASLDYVEQVLKEAGYQTERQAFSFMYDGTEDAGLDLPGTDHDDIVTQPFDGSPQTDAGGVSGRLSIATDGTGCAATSYPDAAGAIAVASRGDCTFAQKAQLATSAGASALLIYNTSEHPVVGSLGYGSDDLVPTLSVGLADGQVLLSAAGQPVTVTYQHIVEERTTYNLIAQAPSESNDEVVDDVVMVGAHLDSVPYGPGINDNASGSATILELAVRLADAGPLATPVRFVWWGAEEPGLLGSTHYVEDLLATDPAALEQTVLYVNADMVASPNFVIGVYDGNESTYAADVPSGSAAADNLLTAYFEGRSQPWVDVEIDGSSDYQPFVDAGVPVAGLFTGAYLEKTQEEAAEFGGTAGEPHDASYHTPDDDLDNVSPEALQICADALAYLVATVSYDVTVLDG